MKRARTVLLIHGILVLLETIALIHEIRVFGAGMLQYYTIDSNVLQLIVSAGILICLLRLGKSPVWLIVLHLVCAVCLTITFLIAAFVLAPQEGFAYYFLSNVAPINHFLGPVLSVAAFVFTQVEAVLPRRVALAPMAFTLIYGICVLLLNIARVLDGPYFFLRVYEVPVSTVVMWFVIIAALCLVFSALYMWLRRTVRARRSRPQT